jgi:hypothetical protein
VSRPNGWTAAWTETDVAYLRENYGKIPVREIAAHLGRTVKAVYGQAALREGVALRESRPWTSAEEDVIRQQYGRLSPGEIGTMIGRTRVAVTAHAALMGLSQREEIAGVNVATLDRLRQEHDVAVIPARPVLASPVIPGQGISRKTLIALSTVHGYFSDVVSVEQAYILGLLAADGNIASGHPRVVFGLKAEDAHLVEWVRDRLNPRASIYRAKEGFAKVQVTSRQMVSDLAQFGIVPRKSRTLQWPANLGPLLPFFLLGYYDGDGTAYLIRDRYPGWSACSGSREFLADMKDYIREMTGVELEKIHHRPNSSLWQVTTTSRGAFILDQWLHMDGLGLARKRPPERVLTQYRPAV